MSDSKKYSNKYWEEEKGQIIEFGNSFMRCFDKAGKLQFGKILKRAEEKTYVVKFVIDRKELFDSEEGAEYLRQTIDDWEEIYEDEQNGS